MAPGGNTVNDTYTVQKGDSLWSIAKRFNVGVDEIKSANNLTSNLINVGQKLVIPGAAPSDQTNVTYVVQKGDSLWSIANANNTTVDEIANLNDLDTNTIYVGQILQIPNSGDLQENPSSTSDTVYVVKSGDTLYSIALRYDTTPNAIINKNNLTSSVLTIGQQLIIQSDPESTGEDDITTNNTYVVQNGDSLYSISRMYGISVDDIKNANNLTSNILTIGQVLTIPTDEVSSNTSNLYVVQKGDSLWSIANRFGVSINQIRMMNNLNSDILNIGQTLIIP